MIPGEYFIEPNDIEINAERSCFSVEVTNTGDRPIQVGSHYHFAEANFALDFDRDKAKGFRLNIPSGTAIRFEPGQTREVELVEVAGLKRIFGFAGQVMGEIK